MKTVLILVIGCDLSPWDKMPQTSLNTWDSIEVPGTETIYYYGNPVKPNTDKFIYFPIEENYYNIGRKTLAAFEWAINNKEFDYVVRVNSSTYVDKENLLNHVQSLPDENVFSGLIVKGDKPTWLWGPFYILSKDVVKTLSDNKERFNDVLMEDVGLSYLAAELGIPFTNGIGCSIDKLNIGWRCLCYGGGESFEFSDFNEIIKAKDHFFFRCKFDADRSIDGFIMKELFRELN